VTARSIGEIALGIAADKRVRSFQPVRRNSYYANDRRATSVWRPIAGDNRTARRIIAARMKAAEFYDRRNKEAGKRNGPLGHIGLEVLRELYRLVDFRSGRLEPAIDTVCKAIRRSRAAVVAAMRRLREHGFLIWVRRSEPTDNAGAGPQIRQITNAYGFNLPKHAAAWAARILGNGPPPDCDVARRERDKAELDAMVHSLPTAEFVDCLDVNPGLAEILTKLGEGVSRNSASSPSGQNPASDNNMTK
jgi:hypothetical protein